MEEKKFVYYKKNAAITLRKNPVLLMMTAAATAATASAATASDAPASDASAATSCTAKKKNPLKSFQDGASGKKIVQNGSKWLKRLRIGIGSGDLFDDEGFKADLGRKLIKSFQTSSRLPKNG